MSNRRAAELPTGRSWAALPRSPSERLEPTRPPRAPSRRRLPSEPRHFNPFLKLLNGLLTFAVFVLIVTGALVTYVDRQLDAPGPLEQPKAVAIPKGEGTQEIASRLEREGIIADRRMFVAGYLAGRLSSWMSGGRPLQLKAGDYQVQRAASIRDVLDQIGDGRTVLYKLTVPEGLTSQQIVDRLVADPNLTGDITEVPPEGSLLPETYSLQRGATRQSVLDHMRDAQSKLIDRLWPQRQADLPVKTQLEALTLASIIEKETGRRDERERVAAVFVNRLRQNMRLQSDPTILYGLFGGKAAWGRPIYRSEIAQKTTHNTYQIDGLPPTPICNPGRAAIEAALRPADTKDLYFVADGGGGHIFAATLKDHNANVAKWRQVEKDIRARQGDGKGEAPQAGPAPPAPAPDKGAEKGTDKGADKGKEAKPAAPAQKTRAVVRQAPPAKSKATAAAAPGKDGDDKGEKPKR